LIASTINHGAGDFFYPTNNAARILSLIHAFVQNHTFAPLLSPSPIMLPILPNRTLFLIGILLCVVAAWFTIGYHNPDEHTQIWEFAHYKIGRVSASELSWEFPSKMRPGLQPFIAYCSILATETLGVNSPFTQAFLMRLLMGIAALFVYWEWSRWLSRDLRNAASIRWLRIGFLFFWLMPYLNVRFSSENTAAISFFGGLLLLLQALAQSQKQFSGKLVWAGLLLGLSFFFRYQIAFAGIGLFAWLLWQQRMGLKAWAALSIGALIAIGVGFVTDYWLYGEWVLAPYNYYYYNIVEEKAAGFGVWPFWWYVTEMPVALVPPLSILLCLLFAVGIWRKPRHPLTWCVVPFIVAHSMIAHKEVRFMFSMALPFFFLATAGWQYFQEKYVVKKWMEKTFMAFFWLNIVIMVFRILLPAKDMAIYYKFIWDWHHEKPETTVYFVKKAPQKHFPLVISFYEIPAQNRRDWYIDPSHSNDTTALRPGDLMVLTDASRMSATAPPGYELELEFTYYPEWLLHFNPNDWQSRTLIWKIYSLRRAE